MFFIEKSLDIRYFFEVGRCFISTRIYLLAVEYWSMSLRRSHISKHHHLCHNKLMYSALSLVS